MEPTGLSFREALLLDAHGDHEDDENGQTAETEREQRPRFVKA